MKLVVDRIQFVVVPRNTQAQLDPTKELIAKSSTAWCNRAGNHSIILMQPSNDPKAVWELQDVLPTGEVNRDGYGVKHDADLDAMNIVQAWADNDFTLLNS